MSHPRVLARETSLLVLIDVQDAYRGMIFEEPRLLRGVCRLLEAAALLRIPVLATEQYPKGLGHTMREVAGALPSEVKISEKRSLSCLGCEPFTRALREANRTQVLLCGLETHACVSQTAHDLLAQGYQVHVCVDAVSSRFELDYKVGLEKLVGSGVVPSTVEMACLEWLKTSEASEFKSIQRLIK